MQNNYLIGMPGRAAATGGPLRMALSGEKFMHAHMILTKHQAEAVYSAMCTLSEVGASVGSISMRDEHGLAITVHTTTDGMWMIQSARNITEWHDSQSSFAAAYGLA